MGAGNYSVIFSLVSAVNYKWSDDTTTPKSVAWAIAPATVAVPALSNKSKTYNGSAQSPTVSPYDSNLVEVTGTTTATNAGSYTVTFHLLTPNVTWADETTADKTDTWEIAQKVVEIPTVTDSSKTYNAALQSPTISAFLASEIIQGGTTSAVNAGTYTISFALTSANYVWSDTTTAEKTVSWSIAKAAGSLSLSKTSVSLNTSTTSSTVTVTRAGDGAITAVSSNTSYATVSVSGDTVTITGVATGSATVTISVGEGTNYLAPTSKTVSVAVQFISNVLNDNSWATISQVAQAGEGELYWDVGDVKMIELNGKIGDYFTANHLQLGVFILDFNHPENGVAENNIIFGGFKTTLSGGKDVALCDSYYTSSSTDGSIYFNMSHRTTATSGNARYGYNYGGWKGSDLRYDILGATSTPPSQYNVDKTYSNVGYDATAATLTSPKANTFLAALPSDLRSVLRLRTHYVDNKGNKSNEAANVTAVIDAVSLLAEFEIFGSRTSANQYEKNRQQQMKYYAKGNSRIKYMHSATNISAIFWECSPIYNGSNSFCYVTTTGSAGGSYASTSFALAPTFKI